MLEYDQEIGLVIFCPLSNLTVNVPTGFTQIFNGILLKVAPPNVFERIA
jgi:hypothetical protein